jgi:hypothetical protein
MRATDRIVRVGRGDLACLPSRGKRRVRFPIYDTRSMVPLTGGASIEIAWHLPKARSRRDKARRLEDIRLVLGMPVEASARPTSGNDDPIQVSGSSRSSRGRAVCANLFAVVGVASRAPCAR